MEIYVGILNGTVELKEEVNPLIWLSVEEENFADAGKFAGMQNIAHIMNIAMQFPTPQERLKSDGTYVGIDGCKEGWIVAIRDKERLRIAQNVNYFCCALHTECVVWI